MVLSLIPTTFTGFRYSSLGDGFCEDWVYLPEGSYPPRLNADNELHDSNAIQECLNRCLGAYGEDGAGTSGGKIGNDAFYMSSNGGCACAVGFCSSLVPGPYESYAIIPGNH